MVERQAQQNRPVALQPFAHLGIRGPVLQLVVPLPERFIDASLPVVPFFPVGGVAPMFQDDR